MNPRKLKIYQTIQDFGFYHSAYPKEDVEWIGETLEDFACQDLWDWQAGVVDDAYDYIALAIRNESYIRYTRQNIVEVVEKLLERHTVFWGLVHTNGVDWFRNENRLIASPEKWEQLIETDPRNAWYYFIGEPLWDMLALIFGGPDFEVPESAENDNESADGRVTDEEDTDDED